MIHSLYCQNMTLQIYCCLQYKPPLFIFDAMLHNQVDGLAMGSLIALALASQNIIFC